jgi:cell division protein FtsI/penicillin-binding protein 2
MTGSRRSTPDARPSEPVNAVPIIESCQYRRLATLALLLLVAFVGLGYRLVELQVTRHEELADLVASNQRKTLVHLPRRAEIRDVKGNVLATSLFVKTVFGDPSQLAGHQPEVAHLLAPLLKLDERQIISLLQPRSWADTNGERHDLQYVVLKKKVPPDDWDKIRNTLTNLTLGTDPRTLSRTEHARYQALKRRVINAIGVDPVDDQLRVYPNGPLAAHVLGYTGLTTGTNRSAWRSDVVGKDGVELTLDSILGGVGGWQRIRRDVRGGELVAHREQDVAPRPGLNVVLTLDAGLQTIVESEIQDAYHKHSPASVSAILVRPRTGEILALANYPTFDPNDPGAADDAARRNRTIADVNEPGSTFKIVTVSGALNEGVVELDQQFDCERGRFYFRGQHLGDHQPLGVLTVEDIIARSSNIGAAKVGIQLGEPRLLHYVQSFGFGERTGIPLPGEVRGMVHPLNQWSKISVAWVPMGHEVSVTPLQMVMAMSAVANGGRLMRPLLVDRVEDGQGRIVAKTQPVFVRQVIGESAARKMVRALKAAVLSGTATKAQVDCYAVAGKTGTAQKIKNGVYSHTEHFASFIGFLPADDPQICLSVVMDEPRQGSYGGETAAPVFQRIATRAASYLGLPPVLPPAEPLPAAGGDRYAQKRSLPPLTAVGTRGTF